MASPRFPTRDSSGGGSGDDSGGGGRDGKKLLSSWDQKWDALDADDAHECTSVAACAARGAGAGAGRGGVISGDARSSEGSKVLMGVTSNTVGGLACRPPDGSKAPGGSGEAGGGGLTGWVGSWLPLTTIAVALVLAALGVRSSPGSSRVGEYDSAPDQGG